MIIAPGPKGKLVDWLSYIESLHPITIDMGLSRVQQVGQALGLIHNWRCPIVMVAGTNGKGTTVKTLSTLLQTLNYKVGSYTSPHLIDFTERVEFNLKPALATQWVEAFCVVEQARVALAQTLTYFEFTTLAALYLFKQQPLDVLILEIGLGGRLDAVNIVNPDISIITSIGFDHCEILGDSLDKIAEEKAGIMRQNKPVIIGQGAYRPHLLVLAKQKQAQIYVRGKDFDDEVIGGEPGQALKALFPESIQLAIQALKLLAPKMALSAEKITQLLNFFPPVSLTGRFQSIHVNQVEWIIDVAHNSHAADWLAEKMNLLPKVKTTHIVWCSFVDKDVEGICSTFFNQLSPNIQQQSCWYMGKLAHIRTATQERLNHVNKIIPLVRCQVLETFEQALDQAYNQAKPGDRILVFGSFQAVSEALIFIQSVSEKAED